MQRPKSLRIVIDMSNSAFEENWQEEAGRILIEAARAIDEQPVRILRDINGNVVGIMRLSNRAPKGPQ